AARPLLELKQPAVGSPPYPLLLTLHGNQQNNEVGGPPWFPALEQGWMLGLVQSSQVSLPDAFEWDNRDIREKELREHYAAACRQAPVDEQRVVIGGYSLGGEAAIIAALNGVIPLRGFIVVVPGGPITTQPEQYAPMIEAARERGLRGGVIIGGRDRMAAQTRTLVEMLRAGGIPCELADYKDMGHEFPPDFSIQLAKMLNFVLGG
ncbi:MAG: hypothetical protein JW963_12445, partial [Anaerolineales bacterium]|nr:hypothetical protein [Anaerolineales bacterium]